MTMINSGHLGGSGIDVLETEPPSAEHPLLQAWRDPAHPAHDRLILNPHSAFYSEECLMVRWTPKFGPEAKL